MRLLSKASLSFVTAAIVAPMLLLSPAHAETNSAVTAPITITASNWKFSPAVIIVHTGVPTTLHVTSTEGVHGIASKDLGIPQTVLVPGKPADVTFTPTKVGTYIIHCTIPCGPGHADMALTIKVLA